MTESNIIGRQAPHNRVTRRTIATGALWATPTVVLATAAPAMAASPCNGYLDPTSVNGPGFIGSGYMCHEVPPGPNNTAFYQCDTSICYTAVFTNSGATVLPTGSQTMYVELYASDYTTITIQSSSISIADLTYSGTDTSFPSSTRRTYAAGTAMQNPRITFTNNAPIPSNGTVTVSYCTKYVSLGTAEQPSGGGNGCPQDGAYPAIGSTSSCDPYPGYTIPLYNNTITYNDAYCTTAAMTACGVTDYVVCP